MATGVRGYGRQGHDEGRAAEAAGAPGPGPRARPPPVGAPAGLRVAVVGSTYPSYELACPHWNGIRRGLEKLALPYRFLTSRVASDFNPNLCAELEEFNPDLIVYGLIDLIRQPELRTRIRERFPRATIVVWYCDLRDDATGQVEADCRGTVDAMFVTNNGQREFYQRKFNLDRVYFLPQACEPVDAPRIVDGLGFDFVFIGAKNFTPPFAEPRESCREPGTETRAHPDRRRIARAAAEGLHCDAGDLFLVEDTPRHLALLEHPAVLLDPLLGNPRVFRVCAVAEVSGMRGVLPGQGSSRLFRLD